MEGDTTGSIRTTSCNCAVVCNLANHTSERQKHIRNISLRLDKKMLSSYKRRLQCANDPRMSSKVIGYLGALQFIILALIIIVPDIIILLKHLTRRVRRYTCRNK